MIIYIEVAYLFYIFLMNLSFNMITYYYVRSLNDTKFPEIKVD